MNSASLLLSLHGAPALLAATTKKTSGSPAFFIFLIVLFGVYFLWLRPQRQKMRSSQVQRNAPEVGDEVATAAGIIGRLVEVDGDRAKVEVAPGQHLTILRTAIGRRLDPVLPESADDDIASSEPVHDDHGDHGDHGDHDHSSDDAKPQRRWWPGSSGSGDDAAQESN